MGYKYDFGDIFWTQKTGNRDFWIKKLLALKVNELKKRL